MVLNMRVLMLFSPPKLPKKVTRNAPTGTEVCPHPELTRGMDAGEAFAALGHQVRVTRAVHFRVHHSIWKAAVKEIGARSTKDTMDIFNIKCCHHNEPHAEPTSPRPRPFLEPPLLATLQFSPRAPCTCWFGAKLRLLGQNDLSGNARLPLTSCVTYGQSLSLSQPQFPWLSKREVNTQPKARCQALGGMTSKKHLSTAPEP